MQHSKEKKGTVFSSLTCILGPLLTLRMESFELPLVFNEVAAYVRKMIISEVVGPAGSMSKLQPAELSYNFIIPDGNSVKYIDAAQCASLVNRKLYRQGRCYYASRVSIQSIAVPGSGGAGVGLYTIPDTWVTSNAWTKSFKLWQEMNKKVLEDNPSVEGKWADYKVFFDEAHVNGGYTSAGPTLNLLPVSQATEVRTGEWHMSTLVLPQHNVDPVTGAPKAADEFLVHMLGDDVAGAGAPDLLKSGAVIHAYADTRARVMEAPDVPGDMSLSWMTLLTDDGSQEPELADLIEGINDNPPYDIDNYPGGDINFNDGVLQSTCVTSAAILSDKDLGFKAPLGLIKVISSTTGDGSGVGFMLKLTLVPGKYRGLMATGVSQ